MSTLKEYVVYEGYKDIFGIKTKAAWESYLQQCDTRKIPDSERFRIITTFNADEQITEPGQPVPAGEWISVEPGNPLPGIDEAVLWFTEDGNQWVDSLDKDESFADFKRHTSVTHWRPLPAPPSPKQEDKQ